MKRLLSVFLSLCLTLSCLLGLGITANAESPLPVPISYDGAVTSGYVVKVKTQEEFKAVYDALDLYKQAEEFQKHDGHVVILLSPESDFVIDNAEPTVYDLSGASVHINTSTYDHTITIGKNTSIIAATLFGQSGFSSDVIVEGKLSVVKCEFYRNLTIAETGILEVTGKEDSSFVFSYFSNAGIMNIRNFNVFSSKDNTCVNNGKIYTPNTKKLYDISREKDVPFTDDSTGSFEKLKTDELSPDENGNANGDTPMAVTGTAISEPTYTVTIPIKVNFGDIKRTKESHIETKPLTVTAKGISNLFANQKKLVVTVESANNYQLSDGTNNLSYKLYTAYTDEKVNTPISNATVLEMVGTADSDTSLAKTVDGAVTIDTQNIKKAGAYTDILTFTVALQEVDG